MKYPYFRGLEADRYSFYRVPKALIKVDLFEKMSGDAKLLYAVLLDRMNLSLKNGWQDEDTRNQFPAKLVKLGAKFSVIVVQISIWLVKIMIKEEAIATTPICHPLNVNATSTTSATTIPITPNIFSPF